MLKRAILTIVRETAAFVGIASLVFSIVVSATSKLPF
jgi:hypothetical protein